MSNNVSSSTSTPPIARDERGLALFRSKGATIKAIVAAKYLVPSTTGSGGYVVDAEAGTCTCPDWQELGGHGRAHRCKHIIATLYVRREIQLPDGNAVVTEERKIVYPRDWRATNRARVLFPRLAPALLGDLIGGLPFPAEPATAKRGRPRVPPRDVLLAAALRVLEDTTAGAAVFASETYQALGLVSMRKIPSYNTLLREFAKPSYMPWLHRMIAASAWPLIGLESVFAIDGTGFGTSVYDCHHDEKHGSTTKRRKPTPRHRWVQATIVFGTKTHVIPAVQVTESNVAECPLMPELLRRTRENGATVREWLGDAAYMAAYNVEAIEKTGASAFIDWPARVTGAGSAIIRRLYNKFQADQEDYWAHYHQRSLAESGMNMIKTRFSHRLRSRVPNAQYAETMLRCVCHNVAMLVQAVEELGVEAKYWTTPATVDAFAEAPPLAAGPAHAGVML